MAHVKILSGDRKGERIEIDRDKIVIGRASDNVVHLDDPSVSGHHCCIIRDGRKFTLQDMESTNGTFLNKVRIKEYRLSPEDIIKAGAIEMLFDGKDVDPVSPVTANDEATQLTTKLEPTHLNATGGSPSNAFGTKHDRKWGWYVGISIGVVLSVILLAWFLLQVMGV